MNSSLASISATSPPLDASSTCVTPRLFSAAAMRRKLSTLFNPKKLAIDALLFGEIATTIEVVSKVMGFSLYSNFS